MTHWHLAWCCVASTGWTGVTSSWNRQVPVYLVCSLRGDPAVSDFIKKNPVVSNRVTIVTALTLRGISRRSVLASARFPRRHRCSGYGSWEEQRPRPIRWLRQELSTKEIRRLSTKSSLLKSSYPSHRLTASAMFPQISAGRRHWGLGLTVSAVLLSGTTEAPSSLCTTSPSPTTICANNHGSIHRLGNSNLKWFSLISSLINVYLSLPLPVYDDAFELAKTALSHTGANDRARVMHYWRTKL